MRLNLNHCCAFWIKISQFFQSKYFYTYTLLQLKISIRHLWCKTTKIQGNYMNLKTGTCPIRWIGTFVERFNAEYQIDKVDCEELRMRTTRVWPLFMVITVLGAIEMHSLRKTNPECLWNAVDFVATQLSNHENSGKACRYLKNNKEGLKLNYIRALDIILWQTLLGRYTTWNDPVILGQQVVIRKGYCILSLLNR
jgi:hypothetical protein